jgi:hypothetical protein
MDIGQGLNFNMIIQKRNFQFFFRKSEAGIAHSVQRPQYWLHNSELAVRSQAEARSCLFKVFRQALGPTQPAMEKINY